MTDLRESPLTRVLKDAIVYYPDRRQPYTVYRNGELVAFAHTQPEALRRWRERREEADG